MKTNKSNKSNKQNKAEGLLIRPESLGTEQTNTAENTVAAPAADKVLPYVNYQQRDQNRSLSTDQVLAALQSSMPEQYGLAEVIGKWIWITFPEQPAAQVRAQISQLGFHWNNHRKCWQHPCGQFATEGSSADPRVKYGTHFAADLKAA